MYNDIITLISTTYAPDVYGNQIATDARSEVFAEVRSIGQSEFYAAATAGLKPEIKFAIADYYDYDGQERLQYGDVAYDIIRTYRKGAELEIVCARRKTTGG